MVVGFTIQHHFICVGCILTCFCLSMSFSPAFSTCLPIDVRKFNRCGILPWERYVGFANISSYTATCNNGRLLDCSLKWPQIDWSRYFGAWRIHSTPVVVSLSGGVNDTGGFSEYSSGRNWTILFIIINSWPHPSQIFSACLLPFIIVAADLLHLSHLVNHWMKVTVYGPMSG